MSASAKLDPRTPVIVGAGQVVQRPGDGESLDPIGLAIEALRRAAVDSGAGEALLRRADSVRQVATTGWLYTDEAALLAGALGARPRETVRTGRFGGDGPGRLLSDTARTVAAGDADVVLVSGAEALATLAAHQRAGTQPGWSQQDAGAPTRIVGGDRHPCNEAETAVGLMAPVNVYALLETAVRARSGTPREEHLQRLASLWSGFSEVAARNEHAWLPRAHTAAEIATPGPRNRLVSDPYTKLMTANLGVDQAAAVIVCSVQAARDLGVPHDRWVFPVASAHAQDEWFFSERGELAASPAIAAAGRAVLDHAGLAVDEVALIDLYSCFPSAVQIAAEALGLPVDDPARPLTVTGGLTFAGGPGNDYALHAVATLVGRLREQPDAYGLSSALGWYCTKHAYGLYSGSPPQCPFAEIDAAGAVDAPAPRAATAQYVGPARLEAYTVTYARDGDPEALLASALTPDGARALVRDDRAEAIDAVLRDDPLGEPVVISPGALELEPSAVSGGGR